MERMDGMLNKILVEPDYEDTKGCEYVDLEDYQFQIVKATLRWAKK